MRIHLPAAALSAIALLLAGCGPRPDAPLTVTATRVALIADAAGAAVLGTLHLPDGFSPPTDGRVSVRSVEAVDAYAATVPLGPNGSFRLSGLPVDAPLLFEVRARYNGAAAVLRGLLKPGNGLNCYTVDVASTAMAAKITSPTPWTKPPAGAWAPVVETMDQSKVTAVEKKVRDELMHGVPVGATAQAQAIARGNAASLVDGVVGGNPGLGASLDASLRGSDANLTVHIASVGENVAPVPGKAEHLSFGVIELGVEQPTPVYPASPST